MARLDIARLGHPVLRRPSRPLSVRELAEAPMQRLIDDMVETMVETDGIGLAAPQVFQSVRLMVMGEPETGDSDGDGLPLSVLVNPSLTFRSQGQEFGWEGCLSIPGLRGKVPRASRVTVEALDRRGRPLRVDAEGYAARVLQHEIDHLDGVVFLDRMPDLRPLSFLEEFKEFWSPDRTRDPADQTSTSS